MNIPFTPEDRLRIDNLARWLESVARRVSDAHDRILALETKSVEPVAPAVPVPLDFQRLAKACYSYRLALWSVSGPEASALINARDQAFPDVVAFLQQYDENNFPPTPQQKTDSK